MEEFLKILNVKSFKIDIFPIKNIFFLNLFNKEAILENYNHSSSPNSGDMALAEYIYKDFSCLLFFLLVQHGIFLS